MKMILAATGPNEEIYYIIDPEELGVDGVSVSPWETKRISFWSYVSRIGFTESLNNAFLRNLWKEDFQSENWVKTYFLREKEIPVEEINKIKKFLVEVPNTENPKPPTTDLIGIQSKPGSSTDFGARGENSVTSRRRRVVLKNERKAKR